jgi:hypothetical protein
VTYAAFAAAHPDAVEAIAIRTLTRSQPALAAPAPGRREPPIEATHMATRSVTGADGYELGAALGDLLRNGAAPHGT